jgi:hypothetical protein
MFLGLQVSFGATNVLFKDNQSLVSTIKKKRTKSTKKKEMLAGADATAPLYVHDNVLNVLSVPLHPGTPVVVLPTSDVVAQLPMVNLFFLLNLNCFCRLWAYLEML